MNKSKLKKYGAISAIVIVVVFAWGLSIASIFGYKPSTLSPSKCMVEKNEVLESKREIIIKFESIAAFGENPPQETKIIKAGDCVDSNPYVSVEKEYSIKANAGETLDKVRKSLNESGYSIKNENIGSEGCKLLYRAVGEKEDLKFNIVIYQNHIDDPSCTHGRPKGVTEEYFRSHEVDSAKIFISQV